MHKTYGGDTALIYAIKISEDGRLRGPSTVQIISVLINAGASAILKDSVSYLLGLYPHGLFSSSCVDMSSRV